MSTRSTLVGILVAYSISLCMMTEGYALVIFNDAMEHVVDGTIDDSVVIGLVNGGTTLTLLPGGSITGDVRAAEDGELVMLGGEVGGSVSASGDGIVTISGGVVQGNLRSDTDLGVTLEGGTVRGDLLAWDGIFRILGTDFRLDGTPLSPQWLTPPLDAVLSGLLADGTDFSNRLNIRDSGLANLITPILLEPGDADRDFDFDHLDIVAVLAAGKYLTGQPATWGEGDWDSAPLTGGTRDNPPVGDGVFDQVDILKALQSGFYLRGPYAAVKPNGQQSDAKTSLVYDPATGELLVEAPANVQLTSINIDSAAGIFTSEPAQNLGGSFDNDSDSNIFKATLGGSFGSFSLGDAAQAGLAEDFLLGDLTVVGSLHGGGVLVDVDLVYVPETASIVLVLIGSLLAAVGRPRSPNKRR